MTRISAPSSSSDAMTVMVSGPPVGDSRRKTVVVSDIPGIMAPAGRGPSSRDRRGGTAGRRTPAPGFEWSAGQVAAGGNPQDAREAGVEVHPVLHLGGVAAVALDAVDGADGGAEALAVDHRVVRGGAGVAGAGHPVPDAGLPGDRRV